MWWQNNIHILCIRQSYSLVTDVLDVQKSGTTCRYGRRNVLAEVLLMNSIVQACCTCSIVLTVLWDPRNILTMKMWMFDRLRTVFNWWNRTQYIIIAWIYVYVTEKRDQVADPGKRDSYFLKIGSKYPIFRFSSILIEKNVNFYMIFTAISIANFVLPPKHAV